MGVGCPCPPVRNDIVTLIFQVKSELNKWAMYRDVGRLEDAKRVSQLQNNLVDLSNTFVEMKEYLKTSLEKSRVEVTKSVEEASLTHKVRKP